MKAVEQWKPIVGYKGKYEVSNLGNIKSVNYGIMKLHKNNSGYLLVGLRDGDIITNPPYAAAQEFVEQALKMIHTGRKVAMFLKLTFLEGQGRAELFRRTPPSAYGSADQD